MSGDGGVGEGCSSGTGEVDGRGGGRWSLGRLGGLRLGGSGGEGGAVGDVLLAFLLEESKGRHAVVRSVRIMAG